MLSIIAAIGNNFELGNNNQLLGHFPKDLKRFKEITSGHPVVMGRKTWESLPVKPLPNRRNIVLTRNNTFRCDQCEPVSSVEEAIGLLDPGDENFIIGGAAVYTLFIDKCQTLYLTRILSDFNADAFFPEVDFSKWNLTEDQLIPKDEKNRFDMRFQKYEKIV